MKFKYLPFLLFVSLGYAQNEKPGKPETADYWRILHASSQNLARKTLRLRGAQDANILNPELKKIRNSLDKLVEAGDLEKEVFEFEYHESLDVFLELLEVEGFDDLVSTYGVFTLSEMVDIGKFFRDVEFAKDGQVSLIVRLPPADLKKFTFGLKERLKKRSHEVSEDPESTLRPDVD